MNNDYEKKLSKAVEKLQEAQKQAKDALAEIDTAAGELLHRGAPALIEEQHADIVDATDHIKSVMARFEVINVEARTGIVDLGNVRKMSLKVSFGMGKLFADTIEAGEAERARRKSRQTTIPGVDGPRMPRGPIGTTVGQMSEDGTPEVMEYRAAQGAEPPLCDGQHPDPPCTDPGCYSNLPAEPPSGLVDQTAAAALPVFLAKVREMAAADAARADGGRFRSADELWRSSGLGAPAEMEPQKPVLFAAYEESYEAAPRPAKKKRGRPKKAEQAGGAA